MTSFQSLKQFLGNASRSAQQQAEIRDGIANLGDLLDRHLKALIGTHESDLAGSARSVQIQAEVREGIANLAQLLDQRFEALIAGQEKQTALLNDKVNRLIQLQYAAASRTQQGGRAASVEADAVVYAQALHEIDPLPMPQFSLRRPDPFSDLSVTKEFAVYKAAFAKARPGDGGSWHPARQAMLYAAVRKLSPEPVVLLGGSLELLLPAAAAVRDGGRGRIVIVDLWGEGLARLVTALGLADGAIRVQRNLTADLGALELAVVSGQDDMLSAGWLLDIAHQSRPGGVIILAAAEADAEKVVTDFMSDRPGWRSIGQGGRTAGVLVDAGLSVLIAPRL